MDAMYRAAMDAPSRVILSESARRRKDRASAARARSKGYSAGGGLTSTLLDRWWSEATGAPARRLPGRPHETPPTTMRGDQAVAFFNRTGLPTGAPSPHPGSSPTTARDSLTRETSPPRLPPFPLPEVLVTVWELAKLDRRGAPTGLLKSEFEAACCLVSLALFENLAALDRRALDARNASTPALRDPRLRKRLGYATRGMYWKFPAFDVSTRTNTNADASANDASDRGSRGEEHVRAIGTSSTTAPAATASEPSRVEPSTSASAASPTPQSAPPLPPCPPRAPPRAPLFAPMSLASTIAWRTPAAGAAMAADAAGLFDGFERISLGEDVAAMDSTARSPFTVDDRATQDAAGSASWDWNAGEDLRPSGSVEFGSMDFSGERFDVPTNPTTNPNPNPNATTVSTSTSTTTARVRPARLQEEEEWSSATRTWPWLAAAAAGASTGVSSDSAATSRFQSGTAGEACEEEREAATNRATPGDWEAFTRSI